MRKSLARLFQSGHINFLIGSGASCPAIATAGQIEQEIAKLFDGGKDEEAQRKLYEFLLSVQGPTNKLINGTDDKPNTATLSGYRELLGIIENILLERRTDLLPKQATVFTTNYDLFIEKAALAVPSLLLNDGFSRVPSLDGRMEYSSRNFFNKTYNTGNVYSYEVEIPSINLLKLHGSLSWKKENDEILFNVSAKSALAADCKAEDIRKWVSDYAVVLPQTSKFRATLMERTYYELLRTYANQLDRENTILIAFGFSFSDQHICEITRRALKNPTLKLLAFAFDAADRDAFAKLFERYNNVDVIAAPDSEKIDFQKFNKTMTVLLLRAGDTK